MYLGLRRSQLSLLSLQLHHSFNVFLQFRDQVSELQDHLWKRRRESQLICEKLQQTLPPCCPDFNLLGSPNYPGHLCIFLTSAISGECTCMPLMRIPGGRTRAFTLFLADFTTSFRIFLSVSPTRDTERPERPALAVRPTRWT